MYSVTVLSARVSFSTVIPYFRSHKMPGLFRPFPSSGFYFLSPLSSASNEVRFKTTKNRVKASKVQALIIAPPFSYNRTPISHFPPPPFFITFLLLLSLFHLPLPLTIPFHYSILDFYSTFYFLHWLLSPPVLFPTASFPLLSSWILMLLLYFYPIYSSSIFSFKVLYSLFSLFPSLPLEVSKGRRSFPSHCIIIGFSHFESRLYKKYRWSVSPSVRPSVLTRSVVN